MKNIKLGAIKGRHEMPVDGYVLEEVPNEKVMDFKYIEKKTIEKLNELVADGVKHINYYPTGLTQVILMFERVIEKYPISYDVYLYDRDKNSYVEFKTI